VFRTVNVSIVPVLPRNATAPAPMQCYGELLSSRKSRLTSYKDKRVRNAKLCQSRRHVRLYKLNGRLLNVAYCIHPSRTQSELWLSGACEHFDWIPSCQHRWFQWVTGIGTRTQLSLSHGCFWIHSAMDGWMEVNQDDQYPVKRYVTHSLRRSVSVFRQTLPGPVLRGGG